MKLDEFTVAPVSSRRVQVFFTEPIGGEDSYEMSLLLGFFRKNKKTRFFYQTKPRVRVEGLLCKENVWTRFLMQVRSELAKGFYEVMRDIPFKSVEEVRAWLVMVKGAERDAARNARGEQR